MAIATPTEYGGYEYEFVNTPPDRCICRICHLPSRDAYMTGPCCQGLTVCKSCLDQWQTKAGNTKCPVCSKEEGGFHKNYPIDREVKSLHIYCSNKERGCEWQGELSIINNHLSNSDGCQFEEVKCSNECGKMIQQQYLTSHVKTECSRRKVNCQYCHDTGEHQLIEGQHKEECLKLPLPCPNKCKVESIPREDMEQHRKECPLEITNCSYDCGKKLKRQCLVNHLKTECPRRKVNCQYCHDTGEHQFIEGQHKEECPKLPLPCRNKCEVGSVPRQDMEAHRKECPLEMIQCEYYSVGCEVRMARKDKEKHKKEKMEDHLMKTSSKLTNTNNQLATALQRINTMEVLLSLATNAIAGSTGSIRSVVLASSLKWADKLAAIAVMSKSGDQCCPVTFKMSEYDSKRRNHVRWYSDPFYTHNKGYRMCLSVDADGVGYGKGTHLSVFLFLMKGPHDDELTWPLRGEFEVKLLNQIGDSEHCTGAVSYNDSTKGGSDKRVTVDKGLGWGVHKLISIIDLNKVTLARKLIKDDCLFFQVTKL